MGITPHIAIIEEQRQELKHLRPSGLPGTMPKYPKFGFILPPSGYIARTEKHQNISAVPKLILEYALTFNDYFKHISSKSVSISLISGGCCD